MGSGLPTTLAVARLPIPLDESIDEGIYLRDAEEHLFEDLVGIISDKEAVEIENEFRNKS